MKIDLGIDHGYYDEVVPGPRVSMRNLPHVLVIEYDADGEKTWDVEHHADCPKVCSWWSGIKAEIDNGYLPEWRYDCATAYELSAVGGDAFATPDGGTWDSLAAGRYEIEAWSVQGGYDGEWDSGIDVVQTLWLDIPTVLSV